MFKDLIGKPFKDLGRGPDMFDCWGLVLEVNRRLGRAIPDYGDGIGRCDCDDIMRQYLEHRDSFETVQTPQAGDIVLFKRTGGGLHFGVAIDGRSYLEATSHSGVIAGRLDHPLTRRLIAEIARCVT